ncbi:hypothetical protein HII36_48450 [Nonomuraea sp. NN258]|uniref:barstar family protein n=1 Tax=Nonomuraea antri TaxID=2730852 RepID=UPI001568628B|nr:barstar family protein [Nonomuraea antri]NRQ39611.1 hypothetical protein [Nonomuraea antri]
MTTSDLSGMRWSLLDEYTGPIDSPDVTLGVCQDIDGLFVDPEPFPPPEVFTLVGCDPAGPLLEASRHVGTERAWLPTVVTAPDHPPGRRPASCWQYQPGYCSCEEELIDVTVVARRPSVAGNGLVDLDLRGYVRLLSECEPPEVKPDVTGFRLLTFGNGSLGNCVDVAGLWRWRPAAQVPPVTLIGLRPLAPGWRVVEGLKITATVLVVLRGGRIEGHAGVLSATVVSARPSRLGEGLLDVVLDGGMDEPAPSGAREIYQMWHDGGPAEPNLWARHDRLLRSMWSRLSTLGIPERRTDKPAGATYHLDGRFVTDIDAFYCALGEAINGPGGFFGHDLRSLEECLWGGWGPPLRSGWCGTRPRWRAGISPLVTTGRRVTSSGSGGRRSTWTIW